MRAHRFVGFGLAAILSASILTTAPSSLPAVAATTHATPATPVAPASPVAPARKSSETFTRPDLTSAQLAARLLKHRIEVTGLDTETTTTWVNLDGTMTTDASAQPVREQVNGAWAKVDTTLVPAPGGGFAPRVSAAPVVFSGGGDAPLVTATTDADASVATKWTGPLPVPTVSGNTATYHDVSPGVNLILTAGMNGD